MNPRVPGLLLAAALLAGCAQVGPGEGGRAHWVASWASAQQIPEPHNALPREQIHDASLRQIVRVSIGGSRLRVRISNTFGTEPLRIGQASLARAVAPGRADIDAASQRALAFDGRPGVTIPAGASYTSDEVEIEHAALADLAITLHLPEAPAQQTSHPGSRTTSFVVRGARVHEPAWPDAARVTHWYQLSDLEVRAAREVRAVVALGDSITDGSGSTTDGNDRWTDFLVRRLLADAAERGAPPLAVLNGGLGGGRLLRDGLGPNLAARFERDVILRAGSSHALVLIGVNDLGVLHRNREDTPPRRAQLLDEMKTALRQMAERAHTHGRCLIGATILPFGGSTYYQPSAETESDRRELNEWIRRSGVFDAVIDFDAALRDPAAPDRLRPDFDSGDHLHLSPRGNRAMADAVALPLLRRCAHAGLAG